MARPAVILTYLVLGLSIFGLIMVGNASVVDAYRDFGDKWHYLKLQAGWVGLGIVAFIVAGRIKYSSLEKLAPTMFAVSLIVLILVLIPGVSNRVLGARRWIGIGSFSFQPAEIAKLAMAIYLAALLKKNSSSVPFALACFLVIALIMLEPDLGTALVIGGMAAVLYFGGGGKMVHFLAMIPVAVIGLLGLILISPYRASRLKTYFNHSHDPLGSSYHIRQVLISLGSGGVWGVGLGQSRQKYEFLPEVTTDSIFAVVAEELGLIGSTLVVTSFLAVSLLGLRIAREARDPFGRNLALAITGWVSSQAYINISAMVALIPLTGVPLPFISYGGSSLVVALTACGILVNIGKK